MGIGDCRKRSPCVEGLAVLSIKRFCNRVIQTDLLLSAARNDGSLRSSGLAFSHRGCYSHIWYTLPVFGRADLQFQYIEKGFAAGHRHEKQERIFREMSRGFDEVISKVKSCGMKKIAVAAAQDSAVLEAVREAKAQGIADAVLVGDESKIREIAAGLGMDLSDYRIIDEPDMAQAALTAVKLAHDGEVEMYMKGLCDTKTFLKSVLDKEVGLRTGSPLSHVAVFDIPGYEKLLFLTDVAFMTYPTLEDKANIIRNTVPVCNACGVTMPKVAPLAAVEVVNPKMPATVEGAELTKMCEEGQITGCIVDGPLSLDLAIDPEAAKHKGATNRKIQGDADILLFPDIHAGNLVYKALVHTVPGVKNGCILTGTKVPVILTSRSDTFETKVNSIALAAVVAAELN